MTHTQLFLQDRHIPLTSQTWDEHVAINTIKDIASFAIEQYQQHGFWPIHPDIADAYAFKTPIVGYFLGAAGTIWGLQCLAQQFSDIQLPDFTKAVQQTIDNQAENLNAGVETLQIDPNSPGYLLGYSGKELLSYQLNPSPNTLDKLANLIQSNIYNPMLEMMWAAPGTMMIAYFLWQKTKEQRWQTLWHESAQYLFDTWQYDNTSDSFLWTQDLYGSKAKHTGFVHGFAGNVFALAQGKDFLSQQQLKMLLDKAQQTLINTAIVDAEYANWFPCVGEARPGREDMMVQLCHGAPGMILGFSPLWPLLNEECKNLLLKAGELTYHAGPLKKPWGLCHGNAGNGYIFLKLYQLTKNKQWQERALEFAMIAISQYQQQYKEYGVMRTDLWCGDIGLAVYLADCLAKNYNFPTIDYFF